MIELAESLGFDTVWVRQRHLQPGISSPVAVLAAASQRTSRIELGTAVIPLGLENPLRLAEDLATVHILSHGRLESRCVRGDSDALRRHQKCAVPRYPRGGELLQGSRVVRLLDYLRGVPVSDFEGRVGIENFTRNVQPPRAGRTGLVRRRPAVGDLGGTAGRQLPDQQRRERRGDVVAGLRHHPGRAYRRLPGQPYPPRNRPGITGFGGDSDRLGDGWPDREVPGLRGGQIERTAAPQGPRGMLFSPDLVGGSDDLADALFAHAGFQRPARSRSRCRSTSTRMTTSRS